MERAYWKMLALLALLVGFAIRLLHLGHDSFWIDEILTAYVTRTGAPGWLAEAHVHPPFYYMLVTAMAFLFGEGEFFLRLPSLWAGVLGIALLLQLGRTLQLPWVGFWAAVLLVVSPFHLKYAQEARQYALLLAVSLLTYILLLRACRQGGWPVWLGYGLATAVNLYTHYGAFLVLGTQAVLLAVWGVIQLRNGRYSLLRYPLAVAGLVLVLYLPWVVHLFAALQYNIGPGTSQDTGPQMPLSLWLRLSFLQFGMYEREPAVVLLLCAILGLLIWLRQRRWRETAVALAAMLLPYLFIQLLGVVRGAQLRYVIYVLPFYLLVAAVLPATLLHLWRRYTGHLPFIIATLLLAALIGWRAWPILQYEHRYMASDWVGVLAHLNQTSQKGDVVVGLSLDFSNRFNIVSASLPYYLLQQPTDLPFFFLYGGELTPQELHLLPTNGQKARALYYNWRMPPQFADPTIKVTPFQSSIYLIEQPQPNGNLYEQLIYLYEQLLPLTLSPAPACDFYQDLAALHTANANYVAAYHALAEALRLCPEPSDKLGSNARPEIAIALLHGLLQESSAETAAYVQTVASWVLMWDRQNRQALDSLTAVNLQTQFQQGAVTIEQELAPEKASIRTFLMPENGDEREVIFNHAPTNLHFTLSLPVEATMLRTQLAIDPQTRHWGGDGVTFIILVTTTNGHRQELFRQHLPNDPSAYGWQEVMLPLSDYAGQAITLTLATETGAAGDGTGDWAGWATPRIIYAMEP